MSILGSCIITSVKLHKLKRDADAAPQDLTNTASLYSSSLTNQHIRLLTIYPSADVHQRLRCGLQRYDITRVPDYESLSYAWGDKNRTRMRIYCDGQQFPVTQNLYHALVKLRLPDRPRLVWVDQLCINQSDSEEKSWQVALMSQIYTKARRVVVWLGYADREIVTAAFDYMESVGEAYRKLMKSKGFESPSRKIEDMAELEMPEDFDRELPWKALTRFFSCTWFERIWCVQEIRLAKSAVIIWGSRELDWISVGATAAWMVLSAWKYDHFMPNDPQSSNALDMFVETPNEEHMLNTLSAFRGFQATDVRDKVYSLVGLIQPTAGADTTKANLVVDYTQSVADVYTHVAIIALQTSTDLAVLTHVSHPADYDGDEVFSSWIPRWDIFKFHFIFEPLYITHRCAYGQLPRKLFGNLTEAEPRLRIAGLEYSTVVWTGPSMRADAHFSVNPGWRQVLKYWKDVRSQSTWRSDCTSLLAMAHTLTGAQISLLACKSPSQGGRGDEMPYLHDFIAYIRKLSLLSKQHDHLLDHLAPDLLDGDWRRFSRIVETVCPHRRLFKMENGSWGLGPDCMRLGDVVAVLSGGQTPYALRPKGDDFLFLGEVYVDELMQGKLVNDMQAGLIHEREFCLI